MSPCNRLPVAEVDNLGLGSIISLVAKSDATPKGVVLQGTDEARLQGYMTVTDLQAQPLELKAPEVQDTQKAVLEVKADNSQTLPEGWQVVAVLEIKADNSQTLPEGWQVVNLKPISVALPLYAYAANTTIRENILLPQTVDVTSETLVKLPEDKVVANKCGKVSFTYHPTTDGITVTRSLSITQQLLTPEVYRDFYALMAEWRDTNNHTLLLKPAK